MEIMSRVLFACHKEVDVMGLENTITEQDLDATSRQFVQGFRHDNHDIEPDLIVDGLSESILSRLIRLFTLGRS
jgi:hypothetical protein